MSQFKKWNFPGGLRERSANLPDGVSFADYRIVSTDNQMIEDRSCRTEFHLRLIFRFFMNGASQFE